MPAQMAAVARGNVSCDAALQNFKKTEKPPRQQRCKMEMLRARTHAAGEAGFLSSEKSQSSIVSARVLLLTKPLRRADLFVATEILIPVLRSLRWRMRAGCQNGNGLMPLQLGYTSAGCQFNSLRICSYKHA